MKRSEDLSASGGAWMRLRRLLEPAGRYRGVIALVMVFLLGCFCTPKAFDTGLPVFLSVRTQRDILFEYSEYGLLATGMTLVILSGGIDLSVGSVLGLSATLFALLTIGFGWSIPAALAAVVVIGIGVGILNGVLVSRFRMQPFVATLATMTAARGAAKMVSGGIKVQPAAQPWYRLTQDTPIFFRWMTQSVARIALQPSTLLFLAVILIVGIIVRRTVYGRQLYAIGGNEEAARLGGIPVARVKIATYALCALFAALAGVVNACRQDIGDPEAGIGFELDAIAAVVIGGTSMLGGQGNLFFTFLGVLIVGYISKILSLNAVPIAPRMMIQAAIIIVAVLVQQQKRNST